MNHTELAENLSRIIENKTNEVLEARQASTDKAVRNWLSSVEASSTVDSLATMVGEVALEPLSTEVQRLWESSFNGVGENHLQPPEQPLDLSVKSGRSDGLTPRAPSQDLPLVGKQNLFLPLNHCVHGMVEPPTSSSSPMELGENPFVFVNHRKNTSRRGWFQQTIHRNGAGMNGNGGNAGPSSPSQHSDVMDTMHGSQPGHQEQNDPSYWIQQDLADNEM